VWTCHTAFPADKLGDISKRYYGEEGSAKKPLEVLGSERVGMTGTLLLLPCYTVLSQRQLLIVKEHGFRAVLTRQRYCTFTVSCCRKPGA
jgi:hypothetical protein